MSFHVLITRECFDQRHHVGMVSRRTHGGQLFGRPALRADHCIRARRAARSLKGLMYARMRRSHQLSRTRRVFAPAALLGSCVD